MSSSACSRDEPEHERRSKQTSSAAPGTVPVPGPSGGPLSLLYLPDSDEALPPAIGSGLLPGAPPAPSGRCPAEMVDVRGEFCIDRYEISLVDEASGRELSPYFHPTRHEVRAALDRYKEAETLASNPPPMPHPPELQLEREVRPVARSARGVIPNGYLSGDLAEAACRSAGKRLCTQAEWVTACRGERGRQFPYGEKYEVGACNVFREAHPAAVLHGNASRHHLDPRLNLVAGPKGPLLRPTGSSPQCRSTWQGDGVFDMVGNLDEWLADGSFAGGFFSRATREGCDARISSHPPSYFDYSLGARCCR